MKTYAAPEPSKTSARPTSQHNENSVLFSLATLQQLTSRQAAAADSVNAAPDAGSKSSVDDILSVGASGGPNSPLAAPVLAPVALPAMAIVAPLTPPRSASGSTSMTGAVIAAAVIVSLGGIGAMALYLRKSEPVALMVASNTDTSTPASAAVIAERAPTPTGQPERAPVPAVVPTPEVVSHRDRSHDRDRRPSSAAHAPTPIAPTPPPVPTRQPAAHENSLDDVMLRAVVVPSSADPAPPAPVAVGPDLPALPTRPSVVAAMRDVGPAVRRCGTGQGGFAAVTVVFNNQGSVNTANVAPPAAGTAVGSCVARAVRGARLSPFARPTFSVTYPFALD